MKRGMEGEEKYSESWNGMMHTHSVVRGAAVQVSDLLVLLQGFLLVPSFYQNEPMMKPGSKRVQCMLGAGWARWALWYSK